MTGETVVGGRFLVEGELNKKFKLLPALVKIYETILRENRGD